MVKIYRLDADLCDVKCALDIAHMSNEENHNSSVNTKTMWRNLRLTSSLLH